MKLENTNCNYCGGRDLSLVFQAKENQFNIGDSFNVVICNNCNLVFTNPRPSEMDISKYYSKGEYYTHLTIDESYKKSKMRWMIKNIIMNAIYSSNKGYEDVHLTIKLRNFIIKLIFQRFVAIIIPFKKNGKILDIGCGNGIFLSMMKQNGWDTYGLEVSEACVIEANKAGINVLMGKLEESNFHNKQFDVIVANQVLEHVYDPVNFLIECRRILKDDGILILGVPNFESYDAKLFKEHWTALQVPTHLYHFTHDTINNLLKKTGFNSNFKYQSILMQYNKQYINKNLHNYFNNNQNKISHFKKISIIINLFILKPFLFLIKPHKGPIFSVNITAYSSKDSLP